MTANQCLGIQNMRIVHFFLILLLAGIVSSCSDTIQVQEGYYGIKTHTGELVEVIKGPGSLVKTPLLEHVVVFARNQELVIQLPHDQKIVLSVEVLDPKQFYFLAAGSYEILASYCERKTEGLSQQEATKLLLNKLNKPDTGIAVKMPNPPLNRTRADNARAV